MSQPASLKTRVECVIAEQVLPALQMDGGSIEVVGVEGGVAQVRFLGTCSGCPGTIMAIVMDIEEQLRKHIPEVQYLEAVP